MPLLEVTKITEPPELDAIKDDWDRLAAGQPFRETVWLLNWWNIIGESVANNHLWCLVVRDPSEKVIGIAPWFLHESKIQGRVVHFLGAGPIATDFLGILCKAEDRKPVVREIAQYMTDPKVRGHWDLIDLDGVAANEPTVRILMNAFSESEYVIHERAELQTWRISRSDSWNAYLSRLSKGGRRKLRTLTKKYFDQNRIHVENATASSIDRFAGVFRDFHRLRQLDLGNHTCFGSQPYDRFLRQAAYDFALSHRLRLSTLSIDGVLAAINYGVIDSGIHYIYQSGMDPRQKSHNPGFLLNMCNVMEAIHQGYALDFMRGDEPYKSKLRAIPTPTVRIRIASKNIISKMRLYAWLVGASATHAVTGTTSG